MSQTTTFTCDRCGRSETGPVGLHGITGFHSVEIHVASELVIMPRSHPRLSALWCLGCCNKMGVPPNRPLTKDMPPPDIADLFREMVREMAIEAVGEAVEEAKP